MSAPWVKCRVTKNKKLIVRYSALKMIFMLQRFFTYISLFISIMLAGSNTLIEGTILLIVGIFMYLWFINTAPLLNLAQIACNLPAVSNVLSQTCSKVNTNAEIMSYTPYMAILIAIFGGILLVVGINIYSGEEQGGRGKASWENGHY